MIIPAIQDSIHTERIEERIDDLAGMTESSNRSHANTNKKLDKLSETLNTIKVKLQAASAVRSRVEDKLDKLLAAEEGMYQHRAQPADTPLPCS